ncbi:hypothetical protein HXX76_006521 [Chlamydomonas incerta]|uniref:EamA domain-containing protein n=1 Tax=Chlamydomonas incerta TaxID=51695 RepID=A0A835SZS3_CHLIN|nr:hypothetical protein HXX76_006521 [Chlamydomonas incerta]|eukprot:KAG2436209.1 hypothetical protein HXX76_006521 [Chlamydomonas incerta]
MALRDRASGGAFSSPWGPVDPRSPNKLDAFLRGPVAAEVSYCLVSAGTILFNKHALSTFEFPAPNVLLTFQFGIAVVLLKVLHLLGFLHLEPLRWDIVKLWFPVNIIFVLMNATGFYALMSVSAGMFTVLKNLSNLLTILGDWYFFNKTYSWQVWACLGLMILSAGLGGWTDLSFSAEGYAWQLVNCVFTAAYSLHLSSVVRAAGNAAAASAGSHGKDGGAGAGPAGSSADRGGSSQHKYHGELAEALSQRHSVRVDRAGGDGPGGGPAAGGVPGARRGAGGGKLNELSMVYYNNVLSVPPLLLLSLLFGEPMRLRNYQHTSNPEFTIVVLMGALLGFGVSFASIWCMSRTSATIYSLTGSMNKVVVAVVGMYAFREPVNFTNLLSIAMGLGAGFLFVFAKSTPQGKEDKDKEKDRSSRMNSSTAEEERQALLGGGEEAGPNGLVGSAVGPAVGVTGGPGVVITVGAAGAVGGGQMLSARTSGSAAGIGLSRVVSTGSGGGGGNVV